MVNTFAKSIIPENEELRIDDLNSYAVLYGYPDKYFNKVASTIAKTFHTPIALISLVGKEHVEFKGNFGMQETTTVDRGVSLCSLAILDDGPTVFKDATREPCLLNNPLVAGRFGLKFYAGVPLTTKDGFNIGTVCIIDKEPRSMSNNEMDLLSQFARNVITELEERRILRIKNNLV